MLTEVGRSGLRSSYRDTTLGRLGQLANLHPETLRRLRNVVGRNQARMRISEFMEGAQPGRIAAWRLWPVRKAVDAD